jgi:hypothetical protein
MPSHTIAWGHSSANLALIALVAKGIACRGTASAVCKLSARVKPAPLMVPWGERLCRLDAFLRTDQTSFRSIGLHRSIAFDQRRTLAVLINAAEQREQIL